MLRIARTRGFAPATATSAALLLVLSAASCVLAKTEYKSVTPSDPTFLISAILPLTESCTDGALKDETGIAITEALDFAVNQVRTEAAFRGNSIIEGLSFEVLDACSAKQAKVLAYDLVKRETKPDIVLSQFGKDDIQIIKILANEKVPQMSYIAQNARLSKDESVTSEDIQMLSSAYPEEVQKMRAVADLIRYFDFDHVYVVGSEDVHGQKGLGLLRKLLPNVCANHISMDDSTQESISAAIAELKQHALVKAVVLHMTGDMEIKLMEGLKAANMTKLFLISTHDWKEKVTGALKKHEEIGRDMVFVNSKGPTGRTYGVHVDAHKKPFVTVKWLEDLYVQMGGNTDLCYTEHEDVKEEDKPWTDKQKKIRECFTAQENLRMKLKTLEPITNVIVDAVYAIAYALKEQGVGESLLSSLSKVNFKNPLTNNQVTYKDLVMQSQNYDIRQVQGSGSSFDSKYIGRWAPTLDPILKLQRSDLVFKEWPISACSEQCETGQYRKYTGEEQCCWDCTTCPKGQVSNTTNAEVCLECDRWFTALPNQTDCTQYSLVYFHWFSAMGQFMIFMVVLGICISLFSLGIISQNSDHVVVKLGGYKLMSFYLLGTATLMLVPIFILIEPTVKTCSSFIAVFHMAMAIPLGVLISKTAVITENLFDAEGDLVRNTLGRRPRPLVILIVLLCQMIIQVVGLIFDPPYIFHKDTEKWDWKYAECSNSSTRTFWVGYFFNFLLAVICNVMSCKAKRINDNFGELKNVCVTTLWFFFCALVHAILIFRLTNQSLAEGQALMSIVYGLFFLVGFIMPKVYIILFKTINEENEMEEANAVPEKEDKDDRQLTAITSAGAGFKNHGIVSIKMRDCNGTEDADDV